MANKKAKAKKTLHFCKKCQLWRGTEIKCPDCGKKTIEVEAPLKRGSYYYIPGVAKPLPAVTTILGDVYAKQALIYWAAKKAATEALANPWMSVKEAAGSIYRTSEEAGARGKDVHHAVESFIKGELVKAPKEIAGYIDAYQKFKKDIPHKVIASEKTIWSEKHEYAGTLDHIIKLAKGELVLIDIKTSKHIYDEAGIQMSAYFNALREMYPTKKAPSRQMVLQLKPDGTYTYEEKNVPLDVFLAIKKVYDWQQTLSNKNGNGEL